MAREVIVQQPALPGFVEDVEALAIARAYFGQIEDYGQGKLALPTLPTAQERAVLEQRAADLRRVLQPISYADADRQRAMLAFGRLFLGYPTLEKVDKAEKAAAYMIDCADLPAFAIEAAVEDIKHGRVKGLDLDYPPSSPRVYKIAEAHRDRVSTQERFPIERVLSVKLLSKPAQTAEEEKRVGELMRGLADSMTVEHEDREREERKVLLDKQAARNTTDVEREWAALGLEPVTYKLGARTVPMSVSLARSLGMIKDKPRGQHPNAPGRR